MKELCSVTALVKDGKAELIGCNVCHEQKPPDDFYRHSKHPANQYRTYKCKDCSRRLNRENYQLKRTSIRRKALYAYKTDYKGRRSQMLAYQIAYREKYPERTERYAKKYLEDHRTFINAKIAAYRRTPKGRFKSRQKQLKRQRMIEGTYSHEEWITLVEKYRMCLMCQTPADQCEITADHVIPLSKGGANTIGNIQPLCRSCNSRKRDSILDLRL